MKHRMDEYRAKIAAEIADQHDGRSAQPEKPKDDFLNADDVQDFPLEIEILKAILGIVKK